MVVGTSVLNIKYTTAYPTPNPHKNESHNWQQQKTIHKNYLHVDLKFWSNDPEGSIIINNQCLNKTYGARKNKKENKVFFQYKTFINTKARWIEIKQT